MAPDAPHVEIRPLVEPNVDDRSVFDLADDSGYERAIGVLADLTDRLMDTIKDMDDDDVRQPSLLPGWSRGHVLTHVARNADGFGNLVEWARTGIETPAYASREARDADIEAGAGRSASELESDVESSGERLLAAIADLPFDQRHVEVRAASGRTVPAHDVLWRRIREVAYHHVDLNAGYQFRDVPAGVLLRGLDEAVSRLQAGGAPPMRLASTDLDWTSEPDSGADDAVEVRGHASDLLAWMTGRTQGQGLTCSGDLPQLPPWG
jgi:maleylpyruvate isomerase